MGWILSGWIEDWVLFGWSFGWVIWLASHVVAIYIKLG